MQLLEFKLVFPDEIPLSVDEYLKGSNRGDILNAASHFLGFNPNNSKILDNREFLSNFFCAENNDLANYVYGVIKNIEKTGTKVGVINPYSSLSLFECCYKNEEKEETQSNSDFEINLFKAYLVLNSQFTSKQKIAFTSTQDLHPLLINPMELFCMQYPLADKVNYDINRIWVNQMLKATHLFVFLESNEKTAPLLKAFLEFFNKKNWQDFLKSLLPLTNPMKYADNEGFIDFGVNKNDDFQGSCLFIEKFIVDENDSFDENDFLSIRGKPFYKVEDGVYRVIFPLFVVEKIFKGLYFYLSEVNKTLDKPFGNIKSFYGGEFSENILLYNVMGSIWNNKCCKFSGKQISEMKIDGFIDYYVRKGKNILLFESKDFLIKADKKASFDFNIYEKEFKKLLYYEDMPNGKRKPKAVIQLINSIRKILRREFAADKDYKYREVNIYPILIIHDSQYDVPGFNFLINYWFQQEIASLKEEGVYTHNIKPLVVINIDSLLYYQVALAENTPLHNIINQYEIQTKGSINDKSGFDNKKFDKYIPFSYFIDDFFKNKGIAKFPPLLDFVAPLLFSNDK